MRVNQIQMGDLVVAKLDPPGPGTDDYWRRYGVEFTGRVIDVDRVNDRGYVDFRIVIEDEDVLDAWIDVCGLSEDECKEAVGSVLDVPDVPARCVLEIVERPDATALALIAIDERIAHPASDWEGQRLRKWRQAVVERRGEVRG